MTTERNLEQDSKKASTSWWTSQRDNIRVIVIALIIALILRLFVAEPRYIPSGSMLPTLQINDRIIVEKVSYLFNQPQRGEIIVFYPPKSPHIADTSTPYIKRIIGLPGDRISIHDKKVFVNDLPLQESYIAEAPNYNLAFSSQNQDKNQSSQTATVPPNSYWVMGDNRNYSNDSHVWGFLPKENIVGRACLRFWPFDARLGWLTPPQY
jgi:signal peptidase I